MGKIDFGTYDLFQWNVIASVPNAVDAYEQHFREVQLAEQVEHRYHFVIEHQGNFIGQCTSPTVYLSALAQRTSTIRFGAMIFQLPFYNPMRLAQDTAMLDQLSRGGDWSSGLAPGSWSTSSSGGTSPFKSGGRSRKRHWTS